MYSLKIYDFYILIRKSKIYEDFQDSTGRIVLGKVRRTETFRSFKEMKA